MKLFIGCSSSDKLDKIYSDDCNKYLEELFIEDNDLVFGAYNKGLMNLSYEIAKKYKRNIIGITPKIFVDDAMELDYTNLIVTDSISKRTEKLIEESDALIFLPGGVGTIYELFTVLESKRSGEFDKPIIIYNCNNFYNDVLKIIDDSIKNNFTKEDVKNCFYVVRSAKETIEYLSRYRD